MSPYDVALGLCFSLRVAGDPVDYMTRIETLKSRFPRVLSFTGSGNEIRREVYGPHRPQNAMRSAGAFRRKIRTGGHVNSVGPRSV